LRVALVPSRAPELPHFVERFCFQRFEWETMLKVFDRLRERFDRPSSSYRPTTESFPDLDVQRIAVEDELARKGAESGVKDRPATDGPLDRTENEVIEKAAAAQKRAHDQVENHIAGFRQRLVDLDFEGLFADISAAADANLADLQAELQIGLDELHGRRRDLNEAEEWRDNFRKRNRLERPCRTSKLPLTVFKWLVIVALVGLELAVNGELLAKNNELGLIGGLVEASLFAVLNVGLALLFGIFAVPQVNHRSGFRKIIGVLGLVAYVICALGINLALAHYREVSGTFVSGAGEMVLQRLQDAPLALTDFRSWLLFAIGLVFSLIALIDALSMRDPYPGYSSVEKHFRRAHTDYRTKREELIQNLQDVRQEYEEVLAETRADIARRRTEHSAILDHRQRLGSVFREHQNQLERAANMLLATYYDANIASRSTLPPARFSQTYHLDRIEVTPSKDGEWNAKNLSAATKEGLANLNTLQIALGKQFEEALRRYRELDNLVPEKQ
jgi:hypothetical protein